MMQKQCKDTEYVYKYKRKPHQTKRKPHQQSENHTYRQFHFVIYNNSSGEMFRCYWQFLMEQSLIAHTKPQGYLPAFN